MRLDASLVTVSISPQPALRGGVINITDEDNVINRYYKVDPSNKSNTVNNKSLGMTPNVSFRVNFNLNKALLIINKPFQIQL
jgi:hypothetical protein